MSTDILLAPVGVGEQLPGGCWDFDGVSATGHFWEGTDSTSIPDLGTKSWVCLVDIRFGASPNSPYIWAVYKDASNYIGLKRFAGTPNIYQFVWVIAGVAQINISISEFVYSCHTPLMVWRDGNTFGLATYGAGGTSDLDIIQSAPGTLAAGDTFTTTFDSTSRMRIGHRTGTTAAEKFNGAIGSVMFAVCASGTLTDRGLSTDLQRKLLMLDKQRLFSKHGFAASELTAFGNHCNSSGVPYVFTKRKQFVAGDRNVCPFTGKFLTINGSASATNVSCIPYTVPGQNDPVVVDRGSFNYLCSPQEMLAAPGVRIAARTQKDGGTNPSYFLEFYGESGKQNRHPHPIPYAYHSIDSSAGNIKLITYNVASGLTNSETGDVHTEMSVIATPAGVVCSPFQHSNTNQNWPATGDTTFSWAQDWLLTDEAVPELLEPYTAAPWGSAYAGNETAYQDGTKTYSTKVNQTGRTLEAWRSRTSAAAPLQVTEFNHSTKIMRTKKIIDGGGLIRSYIGPILSLPDGRALLVGYSIKSDSLLTIAYWGLIIPTAANWDTNAEWKAFDGTSMDGVSGRPLLGSLELDDTNAIALHITKDNDSFYSPGPLPAEQVGMDGFRNEQPIHLTSGIAIVVRKTTDNATYDPTVEPKQGTYCTNSDGSFSVPWDTTEIRRYNYSNGAFTVRDTFDITSLIATYLPGTWPMNAAFNTAVVQYTVCMEVATNMMVMFINDPNGVVNDSTKAYAGSIRGYRLKALLFYRMNATDPRDHVLDLGYIKQINVDGTEGFGIFPLPGGDGSATDKSVLLNIAGGETVTQAAGSRITEIVDMTALIAAALPTLRGNPFASPVLRS